MNPTLLDPLLNLPWLVEQVAQLNRMMAAEHHAPAVGLTDFCR